jgi:hypothetical protein
MGGTVAAACCVVSAGSGVTVGMKAISETCNLTFPFHRDDLLPRPPWNKRAKALCQKEHKQAAPGINSDCQLMPLKSIPALTCLSLNYLLMHHETLYTDSRLLLLF